MSSDMSDLLGIYLEEAEEQLQKLDDGILELEKNPDNIETVKEIFRAAHTLKGSSATMGLTEIAELTHAMENLLDLLRNGTKTATPEIIDLLLEGNDILRQMVDQVSQGEEVSIAYDELAESLKAACANDSDRTKPANEEAKSEKESDSPSQVAGSIQLKVKIDDECMMPSVRAFMLFHTLSGVGEVVSSSVSQDALDDVQPGQVVDIQIVPNESAESVIEAIKTLSEVEIVSSEQNQKPTKDKPVSSEQKSKADGGNTESGSKSIQTVRVGVDRLDTLMNLVAELVIDRTRISQIESDLALKYENEEIIQNLAETAAHVGRVVMELQEHIMKVRLLPVEQVFNRFPRMVRDLAHKAGKEVDFILEGQETELDRSILEDIVDPITHLLRNAIDHGIEKPEERVAAGKPRRAKVVLAAKQEENRIVIEVVDDGKGIDVEKVKQAALKKGAITEDVLSRLSERDALQLIFASGVSTAEKITDVSGRGVGMDVVRNNIQGLSGTVDVRTKVGEGTTFRISLPLTLAIVQALIVGVDERVFVIPLSAVAETFQCSEADIRYIDGNPAINFRGSVLPLVDMANIFPSDKKGEHKRAENPTFVIVNTGGVKVGLIVDRLIGEQEVVIKSLGAFFGDIQGIAGATILGDGRVALIVDAAGLGSLVNRRRYKRGSIEVIEEAA